MAPLPYLRNNSVEIWEKNTGYYVEVVTSGLEKQNILVLFLKKENINVDVKYIARRKSSIIVLYKGLKFMFCYTFKVETRWTFFRSQA